MSVGSLFIILLCSYIWLVIFYGSCALSLFYYYTRKQRRWEFFLFSLNGFYQKETSFVYGFNFFFCFWGFLEITIVYNCFYGFWWQMLAWVFHKIWMMSMRSSLEEWTHPGITYNLSLLFYLFLYKIKNHYLIWFWIKPLFFVC